MRPLIQGCSLLVFLGLLFAGPPAVFAQKTASSDAENPVSKDSGEKTGKDPQNRTGNSLSILADINGLVSGAPEFRGQMRIQQLTEDIKRNVAEAPPEKREEVFEANLTTFNTAIRDSDIDSLPEKVGGSITRAAARMNNNAGNWSEGEEFASRALTYDPDDKDALITRSAARYGLNRFGRSFADADRAMRLAPDDSAALTARALASYGLKNYAQALEDSQRALALDPNNKTAFSVLKLAEGRVRRPVTLPTIQLEQAASVEREYQGMVHQISQVEMRRKDYLANAAMISPAANRLIRRAANKISLKDYWGAIGDASRAIAKAPQSPEAYYYRAAANNLVGEYEAAVRDASQALILDPNDVQARDARTWAFYRLGNYKRAMRDADRSVALNDKNPYAFANRAYVHEKLGSFEAMVSDLRTASSLNPQFESVYRDAIARNSLAEPRAVKTAAQFPAGSLPPKGSAQRKSFATVLVSSLIGGLLIAFGLVHILGEKWKKTMTISVHGPAVTGAAPQRPSTLDATYQIGEMLGQGGMGVVYKAIDKALKRPVAIKMLRPELKADDRERTRFLQEARTVAALHHPSIVDIHTILEDHAGLYLVFEYVDGRSLEDLLAKKTRLSLTETKVVFKRICSALDYAHKHHVVHRDLKPSNIMIATHGEVKVMDFGIARHAKDVVNKYSQTNTVVGTPYYMAPEQEMGIVRKESDIFALGACLYEVLTGERPYPSPASTPMKMAQNYAKPSRLAPLPPDVDALIDAALDPDPDRRIGSANEFWKRLEAIT